MDINQFIQYLSSEKRYSPHTISAYKSDLTQFSEYLITNYKINSFTEVNHKMIRLWVISLMDEGISSRSVNRKISSLKSYYKFLLKEQVISTNPLVKILPPKANKSLPEFVSKEQMELLFDEKIFEQSYEGIRNRLIIETFYFTGIRLTELVNLKNADIDFANQQLKVLGKRNKERIIPFGNIFEQSLKEYILLRNKELGTQTSDKSLFLTKKGLNIYNKLVYRIVNSYLSKVSTLKKKSPHILRHTFATHMLNNGADLNAIKEILGHANLSATQVYTHNTIEKLKSIYNQAHPRA